jgi:hypothetical protein
MLLTAIGIILSVGTWEQGSEVIAKNITIRASSDNRVKINTVIFTDDKECTIPNTSHYTFNTEKDLLEYWNSNQAPFYVTRYEQLLHVSTRDCYAFKQELTAFTFTCIFTCILGFWIDVFITVKLCKKRKVRPQTLAEVVLPVVATMPEKSSEPQSLSLYAAQLMAEAHINRGEVCPITQEPLDKISVLVPECGHVISEASIKTQIPKKCCVCRKDVKYTRVEVKLKSNTVDSTTELMV